MIISTTQRGFERIDIDTPLAGVHRLVQQSSAIGDYEDSYRRPGSSYLWIGNDHHLDREQVAEFIQHLQAWLDTGHLSLPVVENV